MPPLKRKLYELPRDYTEILNKVLTYECPHGASVSGKSKSVAMCLICGEMLCYEVSYLFFSKIHISKSILKTLYVYIFCDCFDFKL